MNDSKLVSVAIDGPAGAGKSTIAKQVAKEKGYIYVDTGAMYRAMALYLIREGIGYNEKERIEEACTRADISIDHVNGEQIVLLNGENVNSLIRTEEVGNMASVSSTNPKVREKLVSLQQKLAEKRSLVMDGRDIGTVVLPNAGVKIYLTASSAIRAKRRYEELLAKGVSCDINEIEKDIIERDKRDMNREISPLKQAKDAILVDSSNLSIEEVKEKILSIINNKEGM
ncbi:MAG: (d)CMP kinase [Lachnospiraceae bacterium]|nr:(d)CMP kinase [Lachnospiraceae bacterium]